MTANQGLILEHALEAAFSANGSARAQKAQNRYLAFCHRLGISAEAGSSRVLHLTWLVDSERRTGKQIERLLTDLDVAARLQGWQTWRENGEVSAFLKGLYRQHRMGPTGERADPLYAELVDELVDAVMAPSVSQLRDQAAVLLVHNLALRQTDIPRLLWRHVTLRHDGMHLNLPPRLERNRHHHPGYDITIGARHGPLCLVTAMRRLREEGARPYEQVFPAERGAQTGQPNQRVAAAVRQLQTVGDVANLIERLRVSPSQLRDRALLLLAYGAALGDQEARDLRQRDVVVCPEGLMLHIAGRSGPTGIAANPGMDNDPVLAWESWLRVAGEQGRTEPDKGAFLRIWGRTVQNGPVHEGALTQIVQRAVRAAGVTEGHYAFSSLRWGLIRTSFRADEPLHFVAQQAGLKSLNRIARHHRREHIIRRSVAGQLGL